MLEDPPELATCWKPARERLLQEDLLGLLRHSTQLHLPLQHSVSKMGGGGENTVTLTGYLAQEMAPIQWEGEKGVRNHEPPLLGLQGLYLPRVLSDGHRLRSHQWVLSIRDVFCEFSCTTSGDEGAWKDNS